MLLRKVVSKKLKVGKRNERLAFFRKNNEFNLQTLKKICKVLIEKNAIQAAI